MSEATLKIPAEYREAFYREAVDTLLYASTNVTEGAEWFAEGKGDDRLESKDIPRMKDATTLLEKVRKGADCHRAAYAGRPLALSRLEFALLARLGEQPARVHTKEALLREIWGYQSAGATRTIDAHACRLRKKLLQAGASGWS